MNNFDTRLKQLIVNNSINEISIEEILEDSNLVNDFGYHSIAIVQLISDIECEFDFEFDLNELIIDNLIHYKFLNELVKNSAEGDN